jgi:DNA-binding CsgD family transcriptional regulator
VVFVGAGGTAMYCNRAAEEVFRANDGLALRNGALGAADRRTHARLRKAIGDALAPSRPPGPAAVAIPRVSLRREYLVMAAPLLTRFAQFNGMARPMAVVLITDPERQTPARQELMIRIYRLTPREAAVAEKLFEGKSVAKAAEELTITYETARTHLRRVFSKTGVSRQAELLLLMARLPAWPGSF